MPRTMDTVARKAQLAEAVWRVILDNGIAAVSVRTVADRAGLAVGSLRHVFPTRAELVTFSAELMVQRATERVLAIEPREDPQEYALAILEELLPLKPDSRAELEINLALLAERTAVPELVAVRDEAHRQLAALSARVVELVSGETGTTVAARRAQRLHALVDGLALHLVHRPPDADPAWAREILRDEIASLAPK